MRRIIAALFCALPLVSSAIPAAAAAPVPAAAAPVPLDYRAYDAWKTIRGIRVSDDGTYLAYGLVPGDGDPSLVIRNLVTGAERAVPRGSAPQFTADSHFIVYTILPPRADVEAAKKAKKPDAEQPKNDLGIINLQTGGTIVAERVKSVIVPRDGGTIIAYQLEPPAHPAPEPSASPAASPAPSAAPTPAPKADKKKDETHPYVLRDLAANTTLVIEGVSSLALSDDGRIAVYATESKDGKADGVHLRDIAKAATRDILTGTGRYRNVSVARDGSAFAFLSDTASYAQDVPHDDLYVVPTASTTTPAPVVNAASAGSDHPRTPNSNGTVTFSRDGKRVFFGLAPAPTPMPADTPSPLAVDLWTYKDARLQSVQKHDADTDRKKTDLAVYDLAAARFIPLATERMNEIITNDNPRYALGLDDASYRIAASWSEDRADVYAISLADGSRRLLARAAAGAVPQLSPDGAYALIWDEHVRHWTTVRTDSGARTVLAPQATVAFYDETDDHPAPAPPLPTGGWIAGDRGVILYDRYDVWLANPASGAAVDLTRGAGRRTNVAYSVMETDRDRAAHPAGEPFLLSLNDLTNYDSGYARIPAAGGVPQTLLREHKLVQSAGAFLGTTHDRVAPPLAARHAERYIFSEESFRDPRDLWSSDATFAHPVRVTNADPQITNYRWGTERIISYHDAHGKPLRAVLLLPDGYRKGQRLPTLVYFYERWVDQFHTFYTPRPGYPTISRYVSHGYAVLLPDVWYTAGHPGASAVDCINAAVDAAEKLGVADPARLGIAGHSWAAYQINYLLTQTHRFRAAEAGAAVSNMTSAYGGIRLESGNVREGQYEYGQSRIGATPWDRPDLYLENSGLFHIRSITTPYLTMHNDADGAVPVEQGIEFITAMRRLGKIAYLFSFNGKDHNLRDTPADRDDLKYWAVVFDQWFDYWLQGAPRPAWFDGVDYLHRGETDVRPLYGEPVR
jgi:dipeptidyl aminopeptidase/acylaminoacyl peptidase